MEIRPPKMIAIPGATFEMGDPQGRGDERPLHTVTLDPYAIAIYPVTNAEYKRFLDRTGDAPPPKWGQPPFDCAQAPVCGVSWYDAVAYGQWLSARCQRCYHLPTEAQREYAVRGGRAHEAYPWGDRPLPLMGPYARGLDTPGTGRPLTMADPSGVGPNDFGLYHMADNIHEWCADYYDRDYYQRCPAVNPRGPAHSKRRAARGGSWRHDIKFSSCAARSSLAPDKQFLDFGFRLASSASFKYLY